MSTGFRRIRPTKPNLDRLVKRRSFADRGAHLLNIKREQILSQFNDYMKLFTEHRSESREKVQSAYQKLNKSFMQYGKRRIKLLAELEQIHYEPYIDVDYVNYMGIDIPKIKLDILEKEKYPSYSFQDTPVDFDDTVDFIKETLESLIKLAELDYIIFHFAFNYHTIQKRINSLESLVVPKLDDSIFSIRETLEDLEREEFIRMKEIKDHIDQKRKTNDNKKHEGVSE